MEKNITSIGQALLNLLFVSDDAPEVAEQKSKGKFPKPKSGKPKAYGTATKYKRSNGYRVERRQNPNGNSDDGKGEAR